MAEEKPKITKDMNIGEIAQKFPDSVEILMEEGMHCIGCIASQFESLQQGLEAHGKSEEEIKDILKRMNKTVTDKK